MVLSGAMGQPHSKGEPATSPHLQVGKGGTCRGMSQPRASSVRKAEHDAGLVLLFLSPAALRKLLPSQGSQERSRL